MSTSSPAIAGFSDEEVSQVLEKAVQDLRYPSDQNETIEESQALKRDLISKAHQEPVQGTVQTLKQVIRSIAWGSITFAAGEPLLVWFLSIRALLRPLPVSRLLCTQDSSRRAMAYFSLAIHKL